MIIMIASVLPSMRVRRYKRPAEQNYTWIKFKWFTPLVTRELSGLE